MRKIAALLLLVMIWFALVGAAGVPSPTRGIPHRGTSGGAAAPLPSASPFASGSGNPLLTVNGVLEAAATPTPAPTVSPTPFHSVSGETSDPRNTPPPTSSTTGGFGGTIGSGWPLALLASLPIGVLVVLYQRRRYSLADAHGRGHRRRP